MQAKERRAKRRPSRRRRAERVAGEEHHGQCNSECYECFPLLNSPPVTPDKKADQSADWPSASLIEALRNSLRLEVKSPAKSNKGDTPPLASNPTGKRAGTSETDLPDDGLSDLKRSKSRDGASMNGMNGAGMAPGMGLPTPAGHQSELNYIWGVVEELSRQLAENRKATEEIVAGMGRVRQRARDQDMSNDDLLASSAESLNGQDNSHDVLISLLSEALDKAKYSRDANAALLQQYAIAMSSMLKQVHEYKARHVSDVSAWHRSYRAQLAEARAENSRLREQMWNMQEHSGRIMGFLRDFRTKFDSSPARHERRVKMIALRQEVRFWKRMAMPEVPEDDSMWSDDDDIIDATEKERLRELEKQAAAAEEQLADEDAAAAAAAVAAADDGNMLVNLDAPSAQQVGSMPMQREDSGVMQLPPRPASAASSTGSSGQN